MRFYRFGKMVLALALSMYALSNCHAAALEGSVPMLPEEDYREPAPSR
jgi:hypothetical protein